MDKQFKEKYLLKIFLEEFKKAIEERTEVPFNPRTVVIMAQPELENSELFEWFAYNKWYDILDVGVIDGKSKNLVELFVDIPVQILIEAEEAGRPLLSEEDNKKLIKALNLIKEIKIGVPEDEKN